VIVSWLISFQLSIWNATIWPALTILTACGTEVPLRPGAKDLLKVFWDATIPMAIATSTAKPMAQSLLKRREFFKISILLSREARRSQIHA
jgi:hypothetical protein